jgi:hypothetical protein
VDLRAASISPSTNVSRLEARRRVSQFGRDAIDVKFGGELVEKIIEFPPRLACLLACSGSIPAVRPVDNCSRGAGLSTSSRARPAAPMPADSCTRYSFIRWLSCSSAFSASSPPTQLHEVRFHLVLLHLDVDQRLTGAVQHRADARHRRAFNPDRNASRRCLALHVDHPLLQGSRGVGVHADFLRGPTRSARDLQAKVQQHIEQGWEPLGGLSVATYGAGMWWYYQALIKRENE